MAVQNFATGPDPTSSVTSRYHTRQIQRAPFVNVMGYSNAEADGLFDREFKELDRAKRAAMWVRVQQI